LRYDINLTEGSIDPTIEMGSPTIVKALLNKLANDDCDCQIGNKELIMAAQRNNPEIVAMIHEVYQKNAKQLHITE